MLGVSGNEPSQVHDLVVLSEPESVDRSLEETGKGNISVSDMTMSNARINGLQKGKKLIK